MDEGSQSLILAMPLYLSLQGKGCKGVPTGGDHAMNPPLDITTRDIKHISSAVCQSIHRSHGHGKLSPATSGHRSKSPSSHRPPVQLEEQENPRCWSAGKKCKWDFVIFVPYTDAGTEICTGILVSMTATIAFYSSIYAAAIPSISHAYSCWSTVVTLGITTFLLGFGSAPLLFAPLSEVWYVQAWHSTRLHIITPEEVVLLL